ncbi:1-acyl-sn-glycerol-3-phosphate acyltransferase [Serratia sp. L9]|uniref:1-acyl-sn-glycerol-3-phosphate acyltransferase n=1 Tax=Serratia sp. L9 TaxID=3423946 RepID=UPI003D6662F3
MEQEPSNQTPGYLRFTPGRALSHWHRYVARLLVQFYYSSLKFVTPNGLPVAPFDGAIPTLILASHRNGATDGWVFNQLLPGGQFLAAVQLLRSRFLRLMFAGIPVVRDKDRERYGYSRGPILHAIAHLKQGGSVVVFPEGTSEWGPGPQPYHPGAAKIIRRLLQEQCRFQVVVAGCFYQAPDRFGSAVELLVDGPVVLPEQGDTNAAQWEQNIQQCLSQALDSVSVNCRDEPMLARVEQQARSHCGVADSYARAFKQAEQQRLSEPDIAAPQAEAPPAITLWDHLTWRLFILTLLPVWLCGWWGDAVLMGVTPPRSYALPAVLPWHCCGSLVW